MPLRQYDAHVLVRQERDGHADIWIDIQRRVDAWPAARADTLTSPQQVQQEFDRLARAGTTDVVLYPSSADLNQVELLADAVRSRLASGGH